MKFIRDNLGMLLVALVILLLAGGMLLMLAIQPPSAPARATATNTSPAGHLANPRPTHTGANRQATQPPLEDTLESSATPSVTPSITPSPSPTPLECTETDRAALQAALAANVALPGVHYETNGRFPPSVTLEGLLSGEVQSLAGEAYSLDLARLFYLTSKKELRWLWLAYGVQYPDGRYEAPHPLGEILWSSHAESTVFFTTPGRLVRLNLSDWYVQADGIHWENCASRQRYTPDGFCAIGLALEGSKPGGSAMLFKSESAPSDWIAFNWIVFDRRQPPDYLMPLILKIPESASRCR